MHELGIVFYIIRDVKETALKNNVEHVNAVVMNIGEEPANIALDWSQLEVDDELSGRKTDFANINYTAKNIWTPSQKPFTTLVKGKGKQRKQMVTNVVNVTVPVHDVVAYRLSPVK